MIHGADMKITWYVVLIISVLTRCLANSIIILRLAAVKALIVMQTFTNRYATDTFSLCVFFFLNRIPYVTCNAVISENIQPFILA